MHFWLKFQHFVEYFCAIDDAISAAIVAAAASVWVRARGGVKDEAGREVVVVVVVVVQLTLRMVQCTSLGW